LGVLVLIERQKLLKQQQNKNDQQAKSFMADPSIEPVNTHEHIT
jgi:hypothetical protein